MRRKAFFFFLMMSINVVHAQNNDSIMLRKIYTETLVNGKAYDWLRDLTSDIGPRLTGSKQAALAVEWVKKTMLDAGADTIILQEVTVPHWVRGEKEKAFIIEANGNKTSVSVCALGSSISVAGGEVSAEVIEVTDFSQLEKIGKEKIKGKIIFYNHPLNDSFINTFDAYGEAVGYRWAGPSQAAKYGAIGTVCRSMTNLHDDYPHTGAMHYTDSIPKVPCCAISTNAADLLSRILKANSKTKFSFTQTCHFEDSVKSYNVIGEIFGSEDRNKYVVVGGHLDSWDLAQGAHDDGAGIVQSIEMLRTIKSLSIKPKYTMRAVAFMNEENGLRGGHKYADNAKGNYEMHIAAIESDAGGFAPTGFGVEMTDAQKSEIEKWNSLFSPYGLHNFERGGDGADINPLENMNVPRLGLEVESQRYFDYHHAATDTFDKVNKRELLLGAAAMTSMAWLLATYGLK